MTRQGWAEKEVQKRLSDGWSGDACVMGGAEAMDMLRKEHARAVRIVLKAFRQSRLDRRGLDSHQQEGYGMACNDIMNALLKGRTRTGTGRKG